MSVKVMRVKTAADVLGSKNLRVYTLEAPGMPETTIVANLTNVYSEREPVAIALPGTKVAECFGGFVVEARKVFGIQSEGMALGKVSGVELGTELGDDFQGQKTVEQPTAIIPRHSFQLKNEKELEKLVRSEKAEDVEGLCRRVITLIRVVQTYDDVINALAPEQKVKFSHDVSVRWNELFGASMDDETK